VDRSAGVLWIVSGALFLRSSGIRPNLSMTHERLPRMGTAHMKRMSGVRGPGMRSIRVMLIRFYPAGCTSIQIAVTLGCE
jgi:hypothetical protein